MKAKLYLTIKVTDREGKTVKQFTRKAHSFLKQYNQFVNVAMSGASESIRSVSNDLRTVSQHANNLDCQVAISITLNGILFGRGSTAVTISDYVVGTLIAEGTGTNELNYQAATFTDPSVSGSNCSFTIVRSGINNSGVTVTVTECVLYCKGTTTPYYFCIVRDVLASSVDVPDGGAITATYTIKVTV